MYRLSTNFTFLLICPGNTGAPYEILNGTTSAVGMATYPLANRIIPAYAEMGGLTSLAGFRNRSLSRVRLRSVLESNCSV
jgi:hypothetical protein